jgi:formamidopyrimidine-DNA glycosylase
MRLLEDVDAFIHEKDLGPDALSVSFEDFRDIIGGKHAMIKSTLMRQDTLAGIGNVYSDEILFQAGVHPRKKIDELDQGQLRNIYDKMMQILHTVIEHDAEPDQFPDDYLTPHRDEGVACPRCGGKVEKVDVSGRSGYYCPACQKP